MSTIDYTIIPEHILIMKDYKVFDKKRDKLRNKGQYTSGFTARIRPVTVKYIGEYRTGEIEVFESFNDLFTFLDIRHTELKGRKKPLISKLDPDIQLIVLKVDD